MATRDVRLLYGPHCGKVQAIEISAANALIGAGRAEAIDYSHEPKAAEPSGAPAAGTAETGNLAARLKPPKTVPGIHGRRSPKAQKTS